MAKLDCFYLLDNDGIPYVVKDLDEWGRGLFDQRRVAETIVGDARVSTVFLGLDHGCGDDPPVLFETMVFGGVHCGLMKRYTSLKAAKEGHELFTQIVSGALDVALGTMT